MSEERHILDYWAEELEKERLDLLKMAEQYTTPTPAFVLRTEAALIERFLHALERAVERGYKKP